MEEKRKKREKLRHDIMKKGIFIDTIGFIFYWSCPLGHVVYP